MTTPRITHPTEVRQEALPLPVALRVEEISEREFDVLFRIAEDPKAASGRLNRVPRRILL